jgi:hypothetical protein
MRHKIRQLQTIREVRVQARQREHAASRQEVATVERLVRELRAEYADVMRAIESGAVPVGGLGETVTATDIDDRNRLTANYKAYVKVLERRGAELMKRKRAAAEAFEQTAAALRNAERAVEQLGVVDGHLAEEEARQAEIQEELQAEFRPKTPLASGQDSPD